MKWYEIIEGLQEDSLVNLKYDKENIELINAQFTRDYQNLLIDIHVYENTQGLTPIKFKTSLINDIKKFQIDINDIIKDSINYTGKRIDVLKMFRILKSYSTDIDYLKIKNNL